MEGSTKVTVNGREYTVVMMSPMKTHDFFIDLKTAQENGKSIADFSRIALGQCCDPMMRRLSGEKAFEECFSEHPEDMFDLSGKAINALIAPFTRNTKDSAKTGNG